MVGLILELLTRWCTILTFITHLIEMCNKMELIRLISETDTSYM